ncbi:uncharacterized protein MONBRDRAFT_8955 [Monosiga brevicollis MX1]|uniref:glucan 1,3-beta-glucosidase n=1 Tax=Monosiga brevicollis TaxID=81824 RepID=A9V1M3_MONBE|nr:uncharacterized protein MONBRDRAFT_8955 [Monosiga brevicollis MX1]EDQ88465.1 predicted protein [Monosiga brevicollis MX1]|eukprot:XP_001746569.1 hypothetical protein [Monosiga brevicollis MX1]
MTAVWMGIVGVVLVGLAAPVTGGDGIERLLEAQDRMRLRRMRRGVNAAHWYSQTSTYSAQRFTAADFALLKQLGLNHVRLPVDESWVANSTYGFDAQLFAEVHTGLQRILDAGLAVILDFHATETFHAKLRDGTISTATFCALWRGWATHLAHYYSPDVLFLELLNEPSFPTVAPWDAMAQALTTCIHEARTCVAPDFTVIVDANLRVSENAWNTYAALAQMTPPVNKRHVVYTFHTYDPGVFTHQGATWGWYAYQMLHDLPYPSTPTNVATLAAAETNSTIRNLIEYYGSLQWNAHRLFNTLAPAFDWLRQHNLSAVCTEFGVYRLVSPPAAIPRWALDAAALLDAQGIGRLMRSSLCDMRVLLMSRLGDSRIFDAGMGVGPSLSNGKALINSTLDALVHWGHQQEPASQDPHCAARSVRPRRAYPGAQLGAGVSFNATWYNDTTVVAAPNLYSPIAPSPLGVTLLSLNGSVAAEAELLERILQEAMARHEAVAVFISLSPIPPDFLKNWSSTPEAGPGVLPVANVASAADADTFCAWLTQAALHNAVRHDDCGYAMGGVVAGGAASNDPGLLCAWFSQLACTNASLGVVRASTGFTLSDECFDFVGLPLDDPRADSGALDAQAAAIDWPSAVTEVLAMTTVNSSTIATETPSLAEVQTLCAAGSDGPVGVPLLAQLVAHLAKVDATAYATYLRGSTSLCLAWQAALGLSTVQPDTTTTNSAAAVGGDSAFPIPSGGQLLSLEFGRSRCTRR